jgi:ribosomal protein L40E
MTMPAGWKQPDHVNVLGGEEVLWRNEITKGIFKKTVIEVQVITNYRVIKNDFGIMLKDVNDITIMNQHRVSQSEHMGVYSGRYARFGMGNSTSRSKTIGDVVFMIDGRPIIVFGQIADPHGVARLAKSSRKQILQRIKEIEKENYKSQREMEKTTKQKTVSRKGIICGQCNHNNPQRAKFCNSCGSKLEQLYCYKCGAINPPNSAYCNECGNNLQSIIEYSSTNDQIFDNITEESIIEDNFLEYQSPDYNFKINYPATWEKKDKDLPNDLIKVFFLSPSENSIDPYLESLSIAVQEISENYTLDDWIEAGIQDMKNKHSDFVLIESLPTTISNLIAHQFVYTEDVYQSLCVATKKVNSIYFILYKAQEEKYFKFLSVIEQMISSFEFIE